MDKTLEEFRLRIAHAQIDSEQIEQDLWDARQRIAALEAEGARLQRVINHIEWAAPPSPAVCVPFCPWCGTIEEEGHRFDCMRQAALEPQKGVGDG